MSMIPNDTQLTMENLYADFHGYLDEKNWIQANAVIENMKEFHALEASRMVVELADAKKMNNA